MLGHLKNYPLEPGEWSFRLDPDKYNLEKMVIRALIENKFRNLERAEYGSSFEEDTGFRHLVSCDKYFAC